ncbi:hypothetical protein [Nocardioides montaniterrae]
MHAVRRTLVATVLAVGLTGGAGQVLAAASAEDSSTAVAPVAPDTTPADTPTDVPSDVPTDEPTDVATDDPTDEPTDVPSDDPTDDPTDLPTDDPTDDPTDSPSEGECYLDDGGAQTITSATGTAGDDATTEEPVDTATDPGSDPTDGATVVVCAYPMTMNGGAEGAASGTAVPDSAIPAGAPRAPSTHAPVPVAAPAPADAVVRTPRHHTITVPTRIRSGLTSKQPDSQRTAAARPAALDVARTDDGMLLALLGGALALAVASAIAWRRRA